MSELANVAVAVVAFLHLLFMILEMVFWKKPLGTKIFGLKREVAESSAALAANQGLYNGFLVAGLVWSLMAGEMAHSLKLFFLGCVLIAGLFGALTVSRNILWVQALPAAVALLLVILAGP